MFDRLTEIRGSQSRQLEAQFADLQDSLVVYTTRSTATEAIAAFTAGFDELDDATISPAQWQSIVDYYNNRFEDAEERRPATVWMSMRCCRRRMRRSTCRPLHRSLQ